MLGEGATPHNVGAESSVGLNLKGGKAKGAPIVTRRTRRIKSHLSTLISPISLPAERADNVTECCRTPPLSAAKHPRERRVEDGMEGGLQHCCIEYRRGAGVLLPANGRIDLNIHAHGRATSSSSSSSSLHLWAFTQHSEISHLQSLSRWPADNRCLASFQRRRLGGRHKCPTRFCSAALSSP